MTKSVKINKEILRYLSDRNSFKHKIKEEQNLFKEKELLRRLTIKK